MRRVSRLFNYLIVLIVVGYGVFYYYSQPKFKDKSVGKAELSSVDIEQVVNKYLKQTTDSMALDQINSQRALRQALKKPLLMSTKVDETNPNSVPIEKQIWKESDAQSTPAEVVNSNMYDEAALNRLDEESRKQYAQDFVENARKGGFHVVLSKDLTKIESVTPIRKPSQQEDSVESFPSN